MLTPRQQQTLDFIEAFQQREAGASPTLAHVRDALGLVSRGSAHALLRKLEDHGRIRRAGKRSIEIVREPEQIEAAA